MKKAVAITIAALMTGCTTTGPDTGGGPPPRAGGPSAVDVQTSFQATEGDIALISKKSEQLAQRCERQANDAKKADAAATTPNCRQLYEDVKAPIDSYWDLYLAGFASKDFKKNMDASLKPLVKNADDNFKVLRDKTVPAAELANQNPATIIAIFELGKKLYDIYLQGVAAKDAVTQAQVKEAVNTLRMPSWEKVKAGAGT